MRVKPMADHVLDTEDVTKGPPITIDGYIPQWDGNNSDKLKNGLAFSIDSSLGDSDSTISSQKAVKDDVDSKNIESATAENDVIVADSSFKWIKKTLAEFKTILGLGTAAYTAATNYVTHGLATAANDFIVASGSGTFVKKTLAEVLAIIMPSPGPIGEITPNTGSFTNLTEKLTNIAVDSTRAITTAECRGQTILINGAYAPTLPSAEVGNHGIVEATTANVFSLGLAVGTDIIELNGVTQTAGYKIISDGTKRARVHFKCQVAGTYIITQLKGVFVDGGA